MLEGPKSEVLRIYSSILADPRHFAIQTVQSESVRARQFRDWSLRTSVLPSGSEAVVKGLGMADGFQPERLTEVSAMGLLAQIRSSDAELMPAMPCAVR